MRSLSQLYHPEIHFLTSVYIVDFLMQFFLWDFTITMQIKSLIVEQNDKPGNRKNLFFITQ